MKDLMTLPNLFSGNSNLLNSSSKKISSGINGMMNKRRSTRRDENSFSSMLNNRVRGANNERQNAQRAQRKKPERDDSHDMRTEKAEFRRKARKAREPRAKQVQGGGDVTGPSESTLLDDNKQVEELKKEARDALTYIGALLGVDIAQVEVVLNRMFENAQLSMGENSELLEKAAELGASNIVELKLTNLVDKLNSLAEFLSKSSSADLEGMVADLVIENDISKKQNEFMDISVNTQKETDKISDFDKIIQIIKSSGQLEPEWATVMSQNSTDEGELTAEQRELSTNILAGSDELDDLDASRKPKGEKNDSMTLRYKNIEKQLNEMSSKLDTAEVAQADFMKGLDSNGIVEDIIPEEAKESILSQKMILDVSQSGRDVGAKESLLKAEVPTETNSAINGKQVANDLLESMKVKVVSTSAQPELDIDVGKGKTSRDIDLMAQMSRSVSHAKVRAEGQQINSFEKLMNLQGSETIDRSTKIDIISQIIDKSKSFMKDGQNMLKIQLNPAKLGEVFMKISVEDGRVTARVMTETSIAKEAVESNLFQLKESLNLQGIKIDKINVFVGDKWQEHKGQSDFQQQNGSRRQKRYKQRQQFEHLQQVNIEAAHSSTYSMGSIPDNERLNFVA